MPPGAELKQLMLREPRLTLAVAESLTCGQVQAEIGAESGASAYFLGGVTAYTLEQKVRHLGVGRAAAESCNSVSREVAEQMARGAALMFGADLAVATTGYAEPDAANNVTAPMAWIALWHWRVEAQPVVSAEQVSFPGATRVQVQQAVTAAVLAKLVKYLREARKL